MFFRQLNFDVLLVWQLFENTKKPSEILIIEIEMRLEFQNKMSIKMMGSN